MPATSSAPDATTTAAWAKLGSLAAGFSPDLRGWFAADAERADRFTFDAADLHVDLSKGLITAEVLEGIRDGRTVAELPHDAISQDAIMRAMAHGAAEEERSQEAEHG